jgi:adenine-specific DNA methylase
MTSYPKRLIEVDLPIKRISAHARREKSIRHGHISTLHIWWARRPLAACRAVICAALWPDPADPLCAQSFRDAATRVISEFARKVCGQGKIGTPNLAATCSEESRRRWEALAKPGQELDPKDAAHLDVLRFALLDFIADFADWDNSTVPEYLEAARTLTQAAHEALGGEPGTRPLVVDAFAGGGSIPLEALRVGADAFASDLNPVAVLLNKAVLEYIPRYGRRLGDEVRKWGRWIKEQAEKDLAPFYPKDSNGATPIAYLWARTVACEGPGCGAEVPLIRSLWLAKKGKRSITLRLVPQPKQKRVDFEIIDNAKATDVGEGTVKRGSATCPVCGFTTPVATVRRQLKERRGGAADARLFAVVTTRPGQQGRFYRLATERDLEAARNAMRELELRKKEHKGPLSFVPEEPLPPHGTLGFRVQLYGMEQWGDLFMQRQALALSTLARLVREAGVRLASEHADGLAEAAHLVLALCASKLADLLNSLCSWQPSNDRATHLFARQAIQMTWDFAESSGAGDAVGNFGVAINNIARIVDREAEKYRAGHAEQAPATDQVLPDQSAAAFITDPPYYDAVPYADLSDFFYVWLKRSLPASFSGLLDRELTEKDRECIVDEVKGKDRAYFEATMRRALLASGSEDTTIKLWDVATGKEQASLKGVTGGAAFSPDGKTLASGSQDNTIKLWDFATGKELITLPGHKDAVTCVAYSPDGKTLASGSQDNTIKLWDVARGEEQATLQGHIRMVPSVAFSLDGKTLASASYDHTIKLWDVATCKEQTTLKGHTGVVMCLAFSPDGKTLAWGGGAQTVELWDVARGKELATLKGHTAWVTSVAFSSDGTTLASGGDGTIKLWNVARDK